MKTHPPATPSAHKRAQQLRREGKVGFKKDTYNYFEYRSSLGCVCGCAGSPKEVTGLAASRIEERCTVKSECWPVLVHHFGRLEADAVEVAFEKENEFD